ncbi:hypothetical protein FK498_17900 [Elioraea sp. Yellowstone]|nr:hypothetical protein FK498_17900 [Elioraea sp. Yellowstone]
MPFPTLPWGKRGVHVVPGCGRSADPDHRLPAGDLPRARRDRAVHLAAPAAGPHPPRPGRAARGRDAQPLGRPGLVCRPVGRRGRDGPRHRA